MEDFQLDDLIQNDLREVWNGYLDRVRPFRPLLHAYCHRLAENLWDAEDLVQETLIRGFHAMASSHLPIEKPRAYMLRIASHAWIDQVRRRETEKRLAPVAAGGAAPRDESGAGVARDAGRRLLQRLAPRERAAVILKDLFEMSLDDIAAVLETTAGAVKSALHRGRERLHEPDDGPASRRTLPSVEVVDRFVELWNAQDRDGLVDLVLENAAVSNVGPGNPYGGEPPRTRDLFLGAIVGGHPQFDSMFTPKSTRVIRAEFEGEPIAVILRVPSDELGRITGLPGEALESVVRLQEEDGHVSQLMAYTWCPETLRALGEALGYPVRTGLYRPPE